MMRKVIFVDDVRRGTRTLFQHSQDLSRKQLQRQNNPERIQMILAPRSRDIPPCDFGIRDMLIIMCITVIHVHFKSCRRLSQNSCHFIYNRNVATVLEDTLLYCCLLNSNEIIHLIHEVTYDL
jgi:hypothetical protein